MFACRPLALRHDRRWLAQVITLGRGRCDLEATQRTEQSESDRIAVWPHRRAGLRPPHNIRINCCDTCALCMIAASLATRPCHCAIQGWRIATVAATDSRVITLGSDIAPDRPSPNF
jgi:hypothetical protein